MKDLVKFGIVAVVGYLAYDWWKKNQKAEEDVVEGAEDAITPAPEPEPVVPKIEIDDIPNAGLTTPIKIPKITINAGALEAKYAGVAFEKMPPAVQTGTYLSTSQKIDYILGREYSNFGIGDTLQKAIKAAHARLKAKMEQSIGAAPVITTEAVVAELEESGEEGAAVAAQAIRGKHKMATLNCVLLHLRRKYPQRNWEFYKKKRVDATFVMERCLRSTTQYKGIGRRLFKRRKCVKHPAVSVARTRAARLGFTVKGKISAAVKRCDTRGKRFMQAKAFV